ncbi:MAG: peptide-methionine (S)-S-oxide reductase [Bacteroidetes bacterium HGW-Bacteroidetes-22]|nr:MAG: peptide-methionine (S)-S-oxide reductase [Bacteroidetes bacterium HGW-Bacteroidetes-22]
MKLYPILIFLALSLTGCSQNQADKKMTNETTHPWYKMLTAEEEQVILFKGTEAPYTGKLYKNEVEGTYICRRCNAPLYASADKFDSQCGWPGFDDEIKGAVVRVPDADGRRTEILCANCGAHLGHVFEGEGLTAKNTRHCVNSISMDFVKAGDSLPVRFEIALFASGCFWGTEHYMKRAKGVVATDVGYTGGTTANPTYKQVCTGLTGHAETVRVLFDPSMTSYETLARLFFETHDPTQVDRQGPDVGTQYRSAIFYQNDFQKEVAEKLIALLEAKGYDVETEVTKAGIYWPAELYHQDYYDKTGGNPYCHFFTKRF